MISTRSTNWLIGLLVSWVALACLVTLAWLATPTSAVVLPPETAVAADRLPATPAELALSSRCPPGFAMGTDEVFYLLVEPCIHISHGLEFGGRVLFYLVENET